MLWIRLESARRGTRVHGWAKIGGSCYGRAVDAPCRPVCTDSNHCNIPSLEIKPRHVTLLERQRPKACTGHTIPFQSIQSSAMPCFHADEHDIARGILKSEDLLGVRLKECLL